MKVIGKSSKFFTLWEVNEEHCHNRFGDYKITRYSYIKNISMDRNVAEKKYPGVSVDLGLRGHSSWEKTEYDKPLNTQFRFGKYQGSEISECSDYSYLSWYWEKTDDEQRSLIESIICGKGWHKVVIDGVGYLLSEIDWERRESSLEYVENLKTLMEENGFLEVLVDRNLDAFGHTLTDNNRVELVFPELQEMCYNGYEYFLPMKNGKGKKIKNKILKITPSMMKTYSFLYGSRLYIEVKDFEILCNF